MYTIANEWFSVDEENIAVLNFSGVSFFCLFLVDNSLLWLLRFCYRCIVDLGHKFL
jgi:hypothetical protein